MTRVDTKVVSRILFALTVSVSLVAGFSMPSWAQQNKPLKVALVTDALFSDGGWGASAYNASQVLK